MNDEMNVETYVKPLCHITNYFVIKFNEIKKGRWTGVFLNIQPFHKTGVQSQLYPLVEVTPIWIFLFFNIQNAYLNLISIDFEIVNEDIVGFNGPSGGARMRNNLKLNLSILSIRKIEINNMKNCMCLPMINV